jgi:hypothetical protein
MLDIQIFHQVRKYRHRNDRDDQDNERPALLAAGYRRLGIASRRRSMYSGRNRTIN